MILSCLTAIIFTACGQQSYDSLLHTLYEHTVPLIQAEALDSLQQHKNVMILDTRAPEEYQISHLPGALHVGFEAFDVDQLEDVPRDQEIVVYCTVGYRSERIGEQLQQAGFKQVKNLYGGIFAWKNRDLEVVNPEGQPTDKVHTYNALWSVWLKKGEKVY